MAMQSGAMVVPKKIPVQWYKYNHHQQPPHHQMDEREGFLMWLRGEFAAANAIIDGLCHHLRAVGEPGEYDSVMWSVQQRRCIWQPILHMQQHFSVGDVVNALHQVVRKRQQKIVGFDGSERMGGGGKEFRRGGRGQRGLEVQNLGGEMNGKDANNDCNFKVNEKLDGGDKAKVEKKEEKEEMNEKSVKNNTTMRASGTQGAVYHEDVKAEDTGSCNVDGSRSVDKSNLEVPPKSFVATEICDGKSVNIAEGLKLYEDLFDDSEILKLNNVVNDLRAAGKKGQLQGQTFVISKRPMKGHGREMIQLGVPVVDTPLEDEVVAGTSKDPKVDPIPELLQNVIERLHNKHVVSIKPDSAIIDVFNEGDHLHPHIWPHGFGRPVCVLFLTVCELTFGKELAMDQPGHYRGALKLSLSPGSMLVMQGRSADFTRHAIISQQKQRILVTLVKSQPRVHHIPSPSSNWAPPIRPPSHMRPGAAKHYGSTGVPPGTSRQQLPPRNSMQPIFVATPVSPGIAFSAPVAFPPTSAGWPAAPPRHPPPPRLPLPGTGVFLPSQGSGNSSTQPAFTENMSMETSSKAEECDVGNPNGARSSPKADDQECDGSNEKAMTVKEKDDEGGAI